MSDKIGKLEDSESLWTELMNFTSTARVPDTMSVHW